MSFYFGDKSWPELEEAVREKAVIILPVGEMEEHSLHLPVDTDARIAAFLAAEIADEIQNEMPVLVMPAIWSGYTPKEVARWPGAMRVRIPVFTDMVHDVCASLVEMGFRKIIMLDCHGQHNPMLNIVTKQIADEYGTYLTVASPFVLTAAEFNAVRKSPRGGVSHACEWETSMILYMNPELVKTGKMTQADIIRHHSDYVAGDSVAGGQKVVWSTWGLQKSKNGGYGDPTVASAETAKVIIAAARKHFKAFIREYVNMPEPVSE
jgi:creatinine amidohydrolase